MSAPSSGAPPPSASPSAAPPPPPAAGPKFDTKDFVFHVDIVLIALFSIYVLTTLPRALARYMQFSHIRDGWVLRSAPAPSSSPDQLVRAGRTLQKAGVEMDERVNTLVPPAPATLRLPARAAHWTTYLHPAVAYVLAHRVAPGYPLGRVCVLAIYFGVVLYAGVFRSNPFVDNVRDGFVAVSQVPIVFALAGKNNVLSLLSGVPYEKLNYIHRFAGRVTVLAANVHAIGFFYHWSMAGTASQSLAQPFVRYGLAALISVDILALGSMRYVREKSYALFWLSHTAGFLCLLVAAYHHVPPTKPYILAATALLALDRVLRLFKSRLTRATASPLPALRSTHLALPALRAGWLAGQHVRLVVVAPSGGMGVGAWLAAAARVLLGAARPFTVADAPGGAGLELIVKGTEGRWTGWLYDVARGEGKGKVVEKEAGAGALLEGGGGGARLGRELQVIVEGPYSGPGHTVFAAYSGAVLVAGGSGITFVLGVLEDLLHKHVEGRSRLCAVDVVWSVANASAVTDVLGPILDLIRTHPAASSPALQLRLAVHYTRASAGADPALQDLPEEITLYAGRPNLTRTLERVADDVVAAHKAGGGDSASGARPSGVVLATCGPVEMADASARAVRGVSWRRWREVGGIETYDEVFGW
ncbi:hypothetical protein DENSPDRAFT_885508 [Dentipellis sp. KUC8613]|nr:hypothetical protein DENSPDRAFT_885508 [Dentipellis sp. KUC8613]